MRGEASKMCMLGKGLECNRGFDEVFALVDWKRVSFGRGGA